MGSQQHSAYYNMECHYAKCRDLSIAMLNVVAPEWDIMGRLALVANISLACPVMKNTSLFYAASASCD